VRYLMAFLVCSAAVVLAGVDFATDATVSAQPARPDAKVLKVYEWGVDSLVWDGSAETEVVFTMPPFYHDATKLPRTPVNAGPPPHLDRRHPPVAQPELPVVYFDYPEPITFDVQILLPQGELTWVYPRPTAMHADGHGVWSGVRYSPAAPPAGSLKRVDPDHWGAFARDGAKGHLTLGDEVEQFLFYEGRNRMLPAVDVAVDANGNITVTNHKGVAIHDVRVTHTAEGVTSAWYLSALPYTRGGGQLTLGEKHRVEWESFSKAGMLAEETQAAGLTKAQAEVFERVWHEIFFRQKGTTLSYRRDPQSISAAMQLSVTPHADENGFRPPVEMNRVSYVYAHSIDLTRIPEINQLALRVIDGQANEAQLQKLGVAGHGALRRIMFDIEQPRARRIAAQQLLTKFLR